MTTRNRPFRPGGRGPGRPAAAVVLGLALGWAGAFADDPPPKPKPLDILLAKGETLTGRLIDGHGHPAVGIAVGIEFDGREIAGVRTDHHGKFRISGLRPGRHRIVTGPVGVDCDLIAAQDKNEDAYRDLLLLVEPVAGGAETSIDAIKTLTADLAYRAESKLPDVSRLPEVVPLSLPSVRLPHGFLTAPIASDPPPEPDKAP